MTWRDDIISFAAQQNRRTILVDGGIGIEFGDGCDVCWILPGEVTTTLAVDGAEPRDVKSLIADYQRIEKIRERAVHALRHHLATMKVFVDYRRAGTWKVQTEIGLYTTVDVGPGITIGAVQGRDAHDLVIDTIKKCRICHSPSRKRIDRYLAMEGPPANERPIPSETPSLGVETIAGVLGVMGLCRALDHVTEGQTSEDFVRAATAKGPIGKALMRMAERLPNAKASCEVTDGSLCIDFEDGENDFVIHPKARPFVHRLRQFDFQTVGDELAEEYLKLNAARRDVLNAIRGAAARRGWALQRTGEPSWYLGQHRREVIFDVGESLTELVRSATPAEALRQLLAAYPDFAQDALAALAHPEAKIELEERELAPDPPAASPALPELTPALIAELDARADQALRGVFQSRETLWNYGKPEFFDPATDRWATMSDWVRLAEQHLQGEWPDPDAILILLDAGDARGAPLARAYLQKATPHPEVSDAAIALAWQFRHELPEIARTWFAPQPEESVPFVKQRAYLGDPVARWYVIAEGLDADDEEIWAEKISPARLGLRPSPEVCERIRRRLISWAKHNWKWPDSDYDEFRTALALSMPDVADALEENPYILASLLTAARRDAGMPDAPGILCAGDLLLFWSRLNPTDWMARLIAAVREEEVFREAERVAREAVAREPEYADPLERTLEIYREWFKKQKVSLAIGWKRWRMRERS